MAQHRVNYNDWALEWAEEFNQPTDTVALLERWRFAYPWGRNLVHNPSDNEYYSGVGVRPDAATGVLNLVGTRLKEPIRYWQKSLRYSSGMLISHHPVDSLRPAVCASPNVGVQLRPVRSALPPALRPGLVSGFPGFGAGPPTR